MSKNTRIIIMGLLCAALSAEFSPSAYAQKGGGRGGGHGGGGGSGFSARPGGGPFGGGGSVGGMGVHSGGSGGFSHPAFSHDPSSSQITHGESFSPRSGSVTHSPGYNHSNWTHNSEWNRNSNWNHNPNWDHNNTWWHDHGNHWVGWWGVGLGWPGYGIGWWPGYYGYAYAGPVGGDIYNSYTYYETPTEAYSVPPTDVAVSPLTETAPAAAGGDMMEFYPQALAAFREGDYRNATRLAAHASIDDARNPNVHLLLMQGLFAIGEYRGAANEAHAVMALGKAPDWPTLYALYGKLNPYTIQLRALETYVSEHPKAAEGRFLLGFQYMIEGHRDAARRELGEALKLTPQDPLAAQLFTKTGGSTKPEKAETLPPPTPVNP
jgi:hypothetical protein